MKKKSSWKSFVFGGLVMVLVVAGFLSIRQQEQVGGIPWILRATHEFNAKIWSALHSSDRMPQIKSAPAGTKPRVNGDLGLKSEIDIEKWRLNVYLEDKLVQTLSMSDLEQLPKTRTASEFFCIEGWSTQFSYAGVRFTDFMTAYKLSPAYAYVGLETPDGGYYVSIDMESMLHSQTVLANEMNERPLSLENGSPLRLIIPIKYGIKSLKRIGTIRFSNTRPRDYWAEFGYDWYSGL